MLFKAQSIWLIKLGIKPERIRAGHPEENGRHERMHRTLKEYITNNPALIVTFLYYRPMKQLLLTMMVSIILLNVIN